MDMEFRSMIPTERNYSYTQSQQLIMQTGCVGHLRGDMDTDGNGFFTSWDDHRSDLKTDEFKQEFDTVINMLRFDKRYGGVLQNRSSLSSYCYGHPDSEFEGNYSKEFGFRADTEQYSYMLRLNPNKGDYNLYCYCYKRDWLDSHIKNAEKGIRFITPNYDEKFRIPDGDKIRILLSDGKTLDQTCRYIDEYHLEVGQNLYHICEFAERMEQNANTVIPLRSALPETCYGTLSDTGDVIIIKKAETGYYKTDIEGGSKDQNRQLVDEYNRKLGVSKAQAEAMSAGSLFGWDVPGADPKNYDMDGNFINRKGRDRGDAR